MSPTEHMVIIAAEKEIITAYKIVKTCEQWWISGWEWGNLLVVNSWSVYRQEKTS